MIERIGAAAVRILEIVGGLMILFARICRSLIPPRYDVRETWRAFYKVGVESYSIVILTALFTGAIMLIQTGQVVHRYQASSWAGWAAGFAVLAEIGPVLIGLMFSGRVGANNTAELGTMVVTEQIDALRTLAIEPIRYLVVPRFLAMIVMLFLLTALGDVFALLGAALTADAMLDIPFWIFLQQVFDAKLVDEYIVGLIKGSLFGLSIAVVSCYFGLNAERGATGVGRAVNASVVGAAIGIFIMDFAVGAIWASGMESL